MKTSVLRINRGDHLKMDLEDWPVVIDPFQIRQVDLCALNTCRIILDNTILLFIYLFIYI